MNVPEIIYEKDDYSDILKKDARFDSRAYDFVLDVIHEACSSAKGHVTGQELLEFFRDLALDAYGPLAYTILNDWGLRCCEDVGAVVFNLYDSKRIGKTDRDSIHCYQSQRIFKYRHLADGNRGRSGVLS